MEIKYKPSVYIVQDANGIEVYSNMKAISVHTGISHDTLRKQDWSKPYSIKGYFIQKKEIRK